MNAKQIIYLVIAIIISISTFPVIWESIYNDVLICQGYNTSVTDRFHCTEGQQALTVNPICVKCINGTSRTILQLIPFTYVAIIIIASVVLGSIEG